MSDGSVCNPPRQMHLDAFIARHCRNPESCSGAQAPDSSSLCPLNCEVLKFRSSIASPPTSEGKLTFSAGAARQGNATLGLKVA